MLLNTAILTLIILSNVNNNLKENIEQFYLTHRLDPSNYYHIASEWTWK